MVSLMDKSSKFEHLQLHISCSAGFSDSQDSGSFIIIKHWFPVAKISLYPSSRTQKAKFMTTLGCCSLIRYPDSAHRMHIVF